MMRVVCFVLIIYIALGVLHHVKMLCSDGAHAVCRNTYSDDAGDFNNIIAANFMDLAALWLIIVMRQCQWT
jgi:hypothetical protein